MHQVRDKRPEVKHRITIKFLRTRYEGAEAERPKFERGQTPEISKTVIRCLKAEKEEFLI
jgi:hypothetical protein